MLMCISRQSNFYLYTGNDSISEDEFLVVWQEKTLGTAGNARTLFHHADTDNNGVLTKNPDLNRVFYYFDSNRKKSIFFYKYILHLFDRDNKCVCRVNALKIA